MSKRVASCFVLIGFFTLSWPAFSQSGALEPVSSVEYDGSLISWNPIEGVSGYNVHLNFSYLDTVTDGTSFEPVLSGRYHIAAFDEQGNFSPLEVIEDDVVPTSNSVDVVIGSVPSPEMGSQGLPPENLTGIVYSRSAGELFWDRVSFQSIEYAVTLNGEPLGSTDGNSFFVEGLEDFAENMLQVSAIRPGGLVSEAVSITFDTTGNNYPFDVSRADSGDGGDSGVTSPQNVSLSVYSLTAAELFWSRASGIVNTEIVRNGELIGVAEGNSFYDDTRESGQAYFYELIAIDAIGDRSLPTVVQPETLSGNTNEVVNRILVGITDVTLRNPHQEYFPMLRAFVNNQQDLPNVVLESSEFITENSDFGVHTLRTYRCNTGSISLVDIDSRFGTFILNFDACSTGNVIVSGDVSVLNTDVGGYNVTYEDLQISESNTDVVLNGLVAKSVGRALNFVSEFYELQFTEFRGDEPNVQLQNTDVTLDQRFAYNPNDPPSSTFTTEFSVTSDWTFGRALSVSTTQLFQDADLGLGNYLSGTLVAVADNGEFLEWDVSFPDASAWSATRVTTNSSISIIGQWSDDIQLPCFDAVQVQINCR